MTGNFVSGWAPIQPGSSPVSRDEEEVAVYQAAVQLAFEELDTWTNNLRAFLRTRPPARQQRKAVLRRIKALRANLSNLEGVIQAGLSEREKEGEEADE